MFINASTDNIDVSDTWVRADLDELKELARYPVALIGDARARMGMVDGAIKLLTPGLRLAGTILPVHAREGDNLAIHRALDEAQPGDVLVVNGQAETSRAVFGDLLGEVCVSRGVAGVIIDGVTRDIDELAALKLPIYARGTSPAGPWKNGPGQVGYPVACGSVVCNPGDVVIGDSDGLIVVPRNDIRATIERAETQESFETQLRATIRSAQV